MSKLKQLGFNIDEPITWINAGKTSAQAIHGVHPFGIDITATPMQWEALMADIADKLVVVQDMPPPVEVSISVFEEVARYKRNKLLSESDWTQIPDASILASKRTEWAAYRKALRDLTSQVGFPKAVIWPQPPIK